jgi:hypothetical protein
MRRYQQLFSAIRRQSRFVEVRKGMKWKWVAVLLAVGFVAMQCRYPAHTNPAFSPGQTMETMIATPPDVHAILRRACADCHSDETNWPWYSYVAPTSWFVVGHVNHGRRFINMSTWVRPGKEPVDSIDRLKAMCREVEKGEMPLTSYKLVHWHAWLSEDDVQRVCAWSEAEQRRLSTVPQ